MQKLKYKVLVVGGFFVDERLLQKGIYFTSTPVLHPFETTIDDIRNRIIEYGRLIQDSSGDKAIENLNQCEFQTVELNFLK